ncbi:MAG: N-acetylglucosamine-6-phosphate deacetylase [Pseudomonadota bacterium]
MQRLIVTGEKVLTAGGWRHDQDIVIENGQIRDLVSHGHSGWTKHDFPGCLIVPGFIDVQVNGGGGVQFNDDIKASTIATIGAAHAQFGTTSFLPTLISDSDKALHAALDAAALALSEKTPGAIGLHLEGPYLNPEKRGIHDASYFRPIDDDTIQRLINWDHGPLVMTLAPEVVGIETIKRLTDGGVILSAGHTAASYHETVQALAHGVRGFTHLYNAMAPLQSRNPGPIAAALESNAWCGIIADGHHVAPSMLQLALRAKSDGRVMLVSDAMAIAASPLTRFSFGSVEITVENGRCVDTNGTLAGSSITMIDAVRYCVQELRVPLEDGLRMASAEPAAFLGKSNDLGQISPGYRANLAVISPNLEVIASFIDGVQMYHKD